MEIFTLVTGILYVILEIRQKNLMWLVGIITSLAAMWVFFRQGLYASFGLNTYYLLTSAIGLWQWRKARLALPQEDMSVPAPAEDVIHLRVLNIRTVIISILILAAGTYALAGIMEVFENPQSWLDSFVTVLSAVATWWLVRCYLQQWMLWMLANALSFILCVSQGLWWMSVLYIVYVSTSVIGYLHWKRCGIYVNSSDRAEL